MATSAESGIPHRWLVSVGWVVATCVGAALGRPSFLSLTFAVVGIFQALVLVPWFRRDAAWWAGASLASGAVGGVAGIVIGVPVGMILSETPLAPLGLVLGGAVGGAGLGFGQWLVLRRRTEDAWSWIIASSAAWALGDACAWAMFAKIDPHGMLLFRKLSQNGWSDTMAAFAVSARGGAIAGLVAGFCTGWWLLRLARKEKPAALAA